MLLVINCAARIRILPLAGIAIIVAVTKDPDAREANIGVAASDLPVFWEVFHGDRADDSTTLLLTTGLGTTDNTIVYGNELMTYLDAFCSLAIANSRAATFQTIGLRAQRA